MSSHPSRWTCTSGGMTAGVLLGIGFAFKLYPAAFVAPLALYVSRAGIGRRD